VVPTGTFAKLTKGKLGGKTEEHRTPHAQRIGNKTLVPEGATKNKTAKKKTQVPSWKIVARQRKNGITKDKHEKGTKGCFADPARNAGGGKLHNNPEKMGKTQKKNGVKEETARGDEQTSKKNNVTYARATKDRVGSNRGWKPTEVVKAKK